jgi:hypothetical protein
LVTSLVSKKEELPLLIDRMKQDEVAEYKVIEMSQGVRKQAD